MRHVITIPADAYLPMDALERLQRQVERWERHGGPLMLTSGATLTVVPDVEPEPVRDMCPASDSWAREELYER